MSEWLHHWLEPITHSADEIRFAQIGEFAHASPVGGGHVLWGAITTGAALVVVILTASFVSGQKTLPATESPEPAAGLPRLLYNKWYVDELYDRIIVRPLLGTSRFLWRWVDHFLIDGVVNLTGALSKGVGWFGSLFQTGQVSTYAFVLTLGALAVLGVLIF
jgi:NADH-quinone oxidoreductase subunit L